MPPRSNPTARQARLGAELRKLREAAGMAAREAGAFLGGNQAQISHIEAGRWGVSAERVRRLATLYSASDEKLIEALCGMAEERVKGWWEEYRGVLRPGFLDLAELEYRATRLRSVQTVNIPGILQSEEYVRAIHTGYVPKLPADEVDARVEFRVRRRTIFERASPTPFVALVHEAALRMRYGGRKVAKGQLEFLLEASAWPAVTVRVIPFTCEDFIEAAHSLLYAAGVVPQLDTVHLDSPLGGIPVTDTAGLARFGGMLDFAERAALTENASRQLIHRIAQEL
ncbi:helix-turn-helix domain-containing protein [Streptomyces sp. NBC_01485]|uniref:helix-turn-helix domain-containing protein n=1 Tax=Streptomyces sp. NBC_01485 TaxID=2903884 RepID=UPI002E321A0C|nr:helix-turn-helix transcriptional regulator [Streptomyces sp. NBC_01485]